jgi:DNA-binding NtrC family response regulator
VIEKLAVYDFPGNVRELENIIERAMVITSGSVLTADAFGQIEQVKDIVPSHNALPTLPFELKEARSEALRKFEKQFLEQLLHAANGSITEAAKLAKIRRQSLHRMLKRHNLTPPKSSRK